MSSSYWSGKTVVVTGAGGFIGSHLAEALVQTGARTRAFVEYDSLGSSGWLDESELRNEMEVFAGDIRDRDSLRRCMNGADVVFHLAALIAIPYSYHAPMSYVDTNVAGTLNVLQAAHEAGAARCIHTSTSEVYGTALRVPIDEDHPLQAQSPYAASKVGADKMANSFYLSFGLPVVTVRPFNTFGPRQSARAVIPTIITQALSRDTVRLGKQTPTRDFTYVADTVNGFLTVGSSEGVIGETYNLGTSREVTISEVARIIARLVGKELHVEEEENRMRPANSEVDRLCAATDRVREATGWRPQYTLEQGLERTIDWMRKNLQRYRPDEYTI